MNTTPEQDKVLKELCLHFNYTTHNGSQYVFTLKHNEETAFITLNSICFGLPIEKFKSTVYNKVLDTVCKANYEAGYDKGLEEGVNKAKKHIINKLFNDI